MPEVYGTRIEEAKPVPGVKETSKFEGAVTVIFPGYPVRKRPERLYVFSVEVPPLGTYPKERLVGTTERIGADGVNSRVKSSKLRYQGVEVGQLTLMAK